MIIFKLVCYFTIFIRIEVLIVKVCNFNGGIPDIFIKPTDLEKQKQLDQIIRLSNFYCRSELTDMLFSQLPKEFQDFAKQQAAKKDNCILDISELLLIQQQTDLITELMKNSSVGSRKCNTLSTEITDLSFDIPENTMHMSMSLSGIQFGKQQSKFFQEESLEEALKQIRKHCSRKTYNFVRDKFKTTEENRKQYKLQKQMKYNQQLVKRCLKLSHQVKQLKEKLEKIEKTKVQEKKNQSKSQMNIQKGQVFLKWEKSMLYKEKVQAQVKKNLNKQFSVLQEEKKQNQQLRQQIQQIMLKIQQQECFDNQNISETISMIKQTIETQRNFSKLQEDDFKRTQQSVQSIMQQLKEVAGCFQ